MEIMSSNMITNKIACKIKQSILYITFLSSEFISTVLVTFVDAPSATFIDHEIRQIWFSNR